MRRNNHWYHVVLTIEFRDDTDSDWQMTERIIYEGKNRDKAIWFMWDHWYLNTPLESDDNGDHWTYIQTLHLRRIR